MVILADISTSLPIIIAGLFALFLLILGILLMFGKGGKFVSGYNFEAKGEKAKKYERQLLSATGILIMLLAPGVALIGISVLYSATLLWVGFGYSIFVVIVGLLIINKSPRLQRAEFLARKYSENPSYQENEDDWKHPTRRVK